MKYCSVTIKKQIDEAGFMNYRDLIQLIKHIFYFRQNNQLYSKKYKPHTPYFTLHTSYFVNRKFSK